MTDSTSGRPPVQGAAAPATTFSDLGPGFQWEAPPAVGAAGIGKRVGPSVWYVSPDRQFVQETRPYGDQLSLTQCFAEPNGPGTRVLQSIIGNPFGQPIVTREYHSPQPLAAYLAIADAALGLRSTPERPGAALADD